MKVGRRALPLLLVLSALFTSMVVFDRPALAETEHITISEGVTIGGTVLKPDTYVVTWNGKGPEVQVSFMKGRKAMATAPARLVIEKNPYDRSVGMKTLSDNTRVLERISFKRETLIFGQA